jgi:hypothetical protein
LIEIADKTKQFHGYGLRRNATVAISLTRDEVTRLRGLLLVDIGEDVRVAHSELEQQVALCCLAHKESVVKDFLGWSCLLTAVILTAVIRIMQPPGWTEKMMLVNWFPAWVAVIVLAMLGYLALEGFGHGDDQGGH